MGVKTMETAVSLTVDVESHGSQSDYEFAEILEVLVGELDTRNIKATFFVNGGVISRWENRIVELHKRGHFIGSHGWSHVPLTILGEKKSKDEINRSYDQLASLVGEKTVLGFRAPYFSLTNSTPWAPDQINNAGFKYSSSVLPGKNPQFAYYGAPDLPFKWPNGLPEFPVPVLKILGSTFPAIGGGYLRILPSLVVNRFLAQSQNRAGLWTYCHPYDFAGAIHMPKSPSWIMSKILMARRKLMMQRILQIISFDAPSLEQLSIDESFKQGLEVFSGRNLV
jgi:peptidoglycan/xylan/chitin deacetylase (PgdA/CDA1 family)